jgi:hypothetical protein
MMALDRIGLRPANKYITERYWPPLATIAAQHYQRQLLITHSLALPNEWTLMSYSSNRHYDTSSQLP